MPCHATRPPPMPKSSQRITSVASSPRRADRHPTTRPHPHPRCFFVCCLPPTRDSLEPHHNAPTSLRGLTSSRARAERGSARGSRRRNVTRRAIAGKWPWPREGISNLRTGGRRRWIGSDVMNSGRRFRRSWRGGVVRWTGPLRLWLPGERQSKCPTTGLAKLLCSA